jgi:hypothetical protein
MLSKIKSISGGIKKDNGWKVGLEVFYKYLDEYIL